LPILLSLCLRDAPNEKEDEEAKKS
jgi:hypothetical protein